MTSKAVHFSIDTVKIGAVFSSFVLSILSLKNCDVVKGSAIGTCSINITCPVNTTCIAYANTHRWFDSMEQSWYPVPDFNNFTDKTTITYECEQTYTNYAVSAILWIAQVLVHFGVSGDRITAFFKTYKLDMKMYYLPAIGSILLLSGLVIKIHRIAGDDSRSYLVYRDYVDGFERDYRAYCVNREDNCRTEGILTEGYFKQDWGYGVGFFRIITGFHW
ncbi:hypothetical protein HDU76_009906 [Blyttiomyces sp. JEL0837]|nr:hypothetical protein HDU76_009906 [Blyttiomyces sp. JEL0837]